MSTVQTMSITQALAELKLIRNRIERGLEDAQFVTMVTKKSRIDTARFGVQAKAFMQQYTDLMERYNRIKAAIVQSNATAVVSIAGKTYTIAEAVERKRSIHMEDRLLDHMRFQWRDVKKEFEEHQLNEQIRIERLLSAELGKDTKTNVDIVQALTKTFMEDGKAELVDPLGLEEVVRDRKKNMDDFKTNVDWVLSEANGKTLITV
jgi:hypothetical protein